ncbi:MFS transporter [Novosphingobium olei]|uniref:MFS transporter n=1 Tax=Novosphingobium olei TaxID=2728851 RepID=A0A7Y0BTB6_9SPHN|nr:MFS transporter [Novosphingobium olei]NML95536.1 MFS transporter [Novosphingobium olei]
MTANIAQDPVHARKSAIAATIGCGLEFYDFMTFSYFAIQIGNCFFPSHDRYTSLMGSLATFGVGFLGRPVGAHVLGRLGDRIGRKPVMLLSMVLMGLAVTTMALTPSYATIGIAAPIIVVFARLVQGFALGGEVSSATVYLVEVAHPMRRATSASLQGVCQFASTSVGALVGLLLSSLLSPEQLTTWGWRVALLIGAAVVPYALVLRRMLPETAPSTASTKPLDKQDASARPSRGELRIALAGAGMITAGTMFTYVANYTTTFGQNQLHLSSSAAMLAQLIGNVIAALAGVAGGMLSDRFGRRPLLILPHAALIIVILPLYSWLVAQPSIVSLTMVTGILAALRVLTGASIYAAISETIAPTRRVHWFALIYALPVTLFGGGTQLFITWLMHATGTAMSLAWYLVGSQVLGLCAALFVTESAPVRRRQPEFALA